MSVYVDASVHKYGRMIMCHMIADTTEELLHMADAIGVNRKWIQKPGTAFEHFDISKQMRLRAVSLGAQEVTSRELATIIQGKRK